uniref:hypothetical protein n=1 Tax=Vibrio alfacsensis TaxID=1074311 RepID=UPI001F49E37A|nr:hypothetical protein [Vibrio alfacsensis]
MDIASFGKLEQMDDFKLSYRDISSKSAYLDLIDKHKPVAGWIKYDAVTQKWAFYQCQCAKVHHDEIKAKLGLIIKNEDSAIRRYNQLPLSTSVMADISAPKGIKKNRWAENLRSGSKEASFCFY